MLSIMVAGGINPQNVMVAGTISASSPVIIGFDSSPAVGSMTPTTETNGLTIGLLDTQSNGFLELNLIDAVNPGQSHFTTLTVWGPGIGVISLTSASAGYSYVGNSAQWVWTFAGQFISGDTYNMRLD